jgi:hypothetical protein
VQGLVAAVHATEDRVKELSFRVERDSERLRRRRYELQARQKRMVANRAAVHEAKLLVQQNEQVAQDRKREVEKGRVAQEIACQGLQERQQQEMRALFGVLPVRISGVARRSCTPTQVHRPALG